MKKVISFLACCLLTVQLFAQAPQRLSYQAIIRNAGNTLVTNAPIRMRISILQGSITGTAVYTELHSTTTNASGVAFVEVGGGTSPSSNFASINWAQGPYFLRSETDPNNGINYAIVTTSQLLSVPYALHSNRVDSSNFAGNGFPLTDTHGELGLYQCNGKVQYTPCLPLVVTTTPSGFTGFGTATGGGNVTSDGGLPVTERGVVWGTAVNPTITLTTKTSNGTGSGVFASSLTNLKPNTQYYVRAYATSGADTAYGNEVSFMTNGLPVVTTSTISAITTAAATGGGNVTESGIAGVTARGIVWSTSTNPTLATATGTSNGIGIGSFTSSLTGLVANTLYYVRAYATNSAGTAYGNEVSFTTLRPTASLTGLACSSATHNGTLTARIAASGVNSVVSYTSGNGGTYLKQTIASTGVTGLTATLEAGTLANGNGTLTYIITGTPSANGTASFALSIGGQSCTLNRMVNFGVTNITAHSCGGANVHNSTVQYGTMTDQQGNIYRTVQIGTQTWMAENLRTTVYRNNTPIENILDNTGWEGTVGGAYCSYNNNTSADCPYGKLYNWYAVKNTNQLCPTGWHVPTDAEWTTLTTFLGGESVAGGRMRSIGTQYWLSPNTDATNNIGWSGLPGGGRYVDVGPFYGIGAQGNWWSATEYSPSSAWYRSLGFSNGDVYRNFNYKAGGFSVRCVGDVSSTAPTPTALLTTLSCSTATHSGILTAGSAASGVNSVVSYTGGNGGTYAAQTINSTGVTGLTATLAAGALANGNGTLTYTITGTPSTNGSASFALSIGGQSCTLNRTVNLVATGITAHTCGATNVHNATIPYRTMADQQGNIYRTVQIGTQTWMAENLRTTVYRNRTPILNITDSAHWQRNTTGAYCSYDNNTTNDCPYGKLYNWYAVNNLNQLCPFGWHVPTDAEWTTLTTFLGGESVAAGKMKSAGTQYWQSPNTDATNSSGWSGLPGGDRYNGSPLFYGFGFRSTWWSSTGANTDRAWHRGMASSLGSVGTYYSYKFYGYPVRCLRD